MKFIHVIKVGFYFSAFVFSYGPLEDVDAEAKETVFQSFFGFGDEVFLFGRKPVQGSLGYSISVAFDESSKLHGSG